MSNTDTVILNRSFYDQMRNNLDAFDKVKKGWFLKWIQDRNSYSQWASLTPDEFKSELSLTNEKLKADDINLRKNLQETEKKLQDCKDLSVKLDLEIKDLKRYRDWYYENSTRKWYQFIKLSN